MMKKPCRIRTCMTLIRSCRRHNLLPSGRVPRMRLAQARSASAFPCPREASDRRDGAGAAADMRSRPGGTAIFEPRQLARYCSRWPCSSIGWRADAGPVVRRREQGFRTRSSIEPPEPARSGPVFAAAKRLSQRRPSEARQDYGTATNLSDRHVSRILTVASSLFGESRLHCRTRRRVDSCDGLRRRRNRRTGASPGVSNSDEALRADGYPRAPDGRRRWAWMRQLGYVRGCVDQGVAGNACSTGPLADGDTRTPIVLSSSAVPSRMSSIAAMRLTTEGAAPTGLLAGHDHLAHVGDLERTSEPLQQAIGGEQAFARRRPAIPPRRRRRQRASFPYPRMRRPKHARTILARPDQLGSNGRGVHRTSGRQSCWTSFQDISWPRWCRPSLPRSVARAADEISDHEQSSRLAFFSIAAGPASRTGAPLPVAAMLEADLRWCAGHCNRPGLPRQSNEALDPATSPVDGVEAPDTF